MKVSTQLELEAQNLEIVINKQTAVINKASKINRIGDLKQTKTIIPYYVAELETKLRVYMAEIMTGNAKVKPVPAKILTLLPPLTVAHFVVKAVINHSGNKVDTGTKLYTYIARQLEVEFNLNELSKSAPENLERMQKFLEGTVYHGDRLTKITYDLLHKYHSDFISKDKMPLLMQLAQLAVHLLADCTPLVEGSFAPELVHIVTVQDKTAEGRPRSKTKIIIADWLLDWVRSQTLEGNLLPNYMTALIEPPKPWTDMYVGGFHSERMKQPFIKTNVAKSKFNFKEMARTVRAVNTLQETEWEINTDVLEVMNYAFVNRLKWGDIPAPQEVVATPYPFPGRTRASMNEEELATVKAWTIHKAHLHDEYHSDHSRYLALNRVLNEAKRFKQYERIYFAYQVDFRGRIYPMAANLSPQGSSIVKSLLRFHNGLPIQDEQAENYLMLQGANTYGEDKLRMDQKRQWVLANERNIIACANSPITTDFWKEADSPWEFLAFCFEWRDYRANPTGFLSRLPIALDGSCNGLQHLSAMMRDEVGGRSVNLTANYNKGDIYSDVKDRAAARLEFEAKTTKDDLIIKIHRFGIERSTCKRPVMIVPYAGTIQACKEYVGDDLAERGAKQVFTQQELKKAIGYLGSVIWQSIGEVVIKGREVMSWFKKAARQSAKMRNDCEIEWVTPNGFRVIQRKVKFREDLYQTHLGDKVRTRLSMRLRTETDVNDLSGHASSVSPNFIHSLDACCLQETVNELNIHLGIKDFAMIHDSYAVHAANAPRLAYMLRDVFVNIYKHNDVIKQWIYYQPKAAAEKFPELPKRGNLNLDEVYKSEHFFS